MPKVSPPQAPKILDLLLLCLMWLREDQPKILRRPGVSIFHLLQQANVISNAERRAILGNPAKHLPGDVRLISLVMQKSDQPKFADMPKKREVEQLCAETDKLLLVLVVPNEALQYHKILGPEGYKLVITNAGIEYAHSIEARYAGILDVQTFKASWAALKHRMRGIGIAKHGGGGGSAGPVGQPDRGHGLIPQAPGYEEEW